MKERITLDMARMIRWETTFWVARNVARRAMSIQELTRKQP